MIREFGPPLYTPQLSSDFFLGNPIVPSRESRLGTMVVVQQDLDVLVDPCFVFEETANLPGGVNSLQKNPKYPVIH